MKELPVTCNSDTNLTELPLADIMDTPAVQSMMEDLYRLTNIGCALVDLRGNVLVAVGWQDICTKFHRIHPETLKNCQKSDTELSNGVPFGQYKAYHCKNNLWDVSTPIVMNNKHVGNIFLGQFFYEDEEIDKDFFRKQALQYNFNEEEYLSALKRVPRYRRETVDAAMSLYAKLAGMISTLSYSNFQQKKMLQEHKRVEEELRRKEYDLTESQRIAHIGSWRLDVATNQVTWTEELYNMYGFDPSLPPPPYTEHMKLFTPESWERLSTALSHTRETGIPYTLELETIRKDGSHGWMWVQGEADVDSEGKTVELWGAAQDITERKQAEESLRKSETLYRSLVETLPQCILRKDVEGRFTFVDSNFCCSVNRAPGEILGKTDYDFYPKELAEKYRTDDVYVIENNVTFECVEEYVLPDGEMRFVQVVKTPLHDASGKVSGIQCIFSDITERLRAEEALRESENRFQKMLSVVPDMISIHDSDLNILYSNWQGFASVPEKKELSIRNVSKLTVVWIIYAQIAKQKLSLKRENPSKTMLSCQTVDGLIYVYYRCWTEMDLLTCSWNGFET
jgi:PAS domain S-box-containing protein